MKGVKDLILQSHSDYSGNPFGYVFTTHGTKYPNTYKKIKIHEGEKLIVSHYTGFARVATVKKVFKNGSISMLTHGINRIDKYEPTNEGRVYIDVWK